MAYLPVKTRPNFSAQGATSFLAKKGVDLRDLPQLLSPEFALNIKNFYVTADGGLIKRKGIEKLEEVAGGHPVRMMVAYDNNTLIYAYNDKIAAYDIAADTSTIINTYSVSSSLYSGDRYGGYFFVTNSKSSIGRISRTLAYDNQTSNFTAGAILTGATSGATAVILQDSDSGATGTLTLGYVVGTFQDNEIITDSSTGSATVNGTITWAFATISGSPICRVLRVIGNRLFAGGISEDESGVWYSQADTGTNPPFSTWTTGTNQGDPGKIFFRNAGRVNDVREFGQNIIVVLSEYGKWAFYISVIDSSGTLKKVDEVVMQKVDFGGNTALMTDHGFFYVNESGLWNLVSLGQPNVAFSKQESQESVLLGNAYFQDVDFSRASMVYDPVRKLVLVTCAKDSDTNNFVIVYNVDFKAFTFFDGWNVSKFTDINGTIYASSDLDTKLYQVFNSDSDDGNDIWCEFYQELRMGGLWTRQILKEFYIQGFLSDSSEVRLSFDIYDKDGTFIEDKTVWEWTPQSSNNLSDGFGVASWGTSSWGGDIDLASTVESFDGCDPRISNFQRLRVKITENSQLPLAINWFSVAGRSKTKIRRRKITKVS